MNLLDNFGRAIDEFLPKAILDATQVILSMIGAVTVAATANPIFLVPVVVMAFFFIFIQRAFLRTSKNIKRLESNGEQMAGMPCKCI